MPPPSSPDYPQILADTYDFIPLYAGRGDVDFYVDCAREARGPVLELGCGTGRILVPTAAAGCAITGLDRSEAMLARCRAKLADQPEEVRGRAQLVRGSMTDFALGERFALVSIPFRGFQHLLTVEEQLRCLRAAREHLAPEGRLVLDVFQVIPQATFDPSWQVEREEGPAVELPDGRAVRRTHRVAAFHRAEQVNEVEFIFYVTHPGGRSERLVERFPFRYFYRYEIEHLLARAGFRAAAVYGDFDRSALADASPEMIFVAGPAPPVAAAGPVRYSR